jgi:hypothetical protein
MIMGFKKLVDYYVLRKSLKEIEMNRILEKIYKKIKISTKEKKFLDLYNRTTEEIGKDLMFLSKNATSRKVKEILERGKKVICDLHDRDGKIGLEILSIENNVDSVTCDVIMRNETHQLHDRFLYNIIYNNIKKEYSLQEQDEYYEKIEATK